MSRLKDLLLQLLQTMFIRIVSQWSGNQTLFGEDHFHEHVCQRAKTPWFSLDWLYRWCCSKELATLVLSESSIDGAHDNQNDIFNFPSVLN